MEENKSADVIYLDFAKAFDKVDHGILLRKLISMEFSHNLINWIREFLLNRKQAVIVNGTRSPYHEAISGVPQGTVLGPVLFLIYIADIDSELIHSKASSFADDTRPILPLEKMGDYALLQEDLHRVYNWAEQNNMSFNAEKFVHMRYGNRTSVSSESHVGKY